MATEDGSLGASQHHDEQEWEAQKPNFTHYYKTQEMTLVQATQKMIEEHNFYATPRQWERRVSKWKLSKYTNRQERLDQIAAQGKSVLEVAHAPRRPRAHSTELLRAPDSDRNIKRFAKREVSRSRSRSRTNSVGNQSRNSSAHSARRAHSPAEQIVSEQILNIDYTALGNDVNTFIGIPAVPTDRDSDTPQAHVMETLNPITGEMGHEVHVSVPGPPFAPGGAFDSQAFSHDGSNFGLPDLDGQFAPDQMALDFGSDLNPQADMASLQNGMMPVSASMYNPVSWNTSSPFTDPSINGTQPFPDLGVDLAQSMDPMVQQFSQPQIARLRSVGSLSDAGNFQTTSMPTVQITLPDNDHPTLLHDQTQAIPLGQSSNRLRSLSGPFSEVQRYIGDYMDNMLERILQTVESTNDPVSLRSNLTLGMGYERTVFMNEVASQLEGVSRAQQRAIQSIYEKCKQLRKDKDDLKDKNTMLVQKVTEHQRAAMARHFSDPSIYNSLNHIPY